MKRKKNNKRSDFSRMAGQECPGVFRATEILPESKQRNVTTINTS